MTRWEVWSGELQEKEMSDYKKALFDIRIALESSENVSHSEEVGLLLAYTDYVFGKLEIKKEYEEKYWVKSEYKK